MNRIETDLDFDNAIWPFKKIVARRKENRGIKTTAIAQLAADAKAKAIADARAKAKAIADAKALAKAQAQAAAQAAADAQAAAQIAADAQAAAQVAARPTRKDDVEANIRMALEENEAAAAQTVENTPILSTPIVDNVEAVDTIESGASLKDQLMKYKYYIGGAIVLSIVGIIVIRKI